MDTPSSLSRARHTFHVIERARPASTTQESADVCARRPCTFFQAVHLFFRRANEKVQPNSARGRATVGRAGFACLFLFFTTSLNAACPLPYFLYSDFTKKCENVQKVQKPSAMHRGPPYSMHLFHSGQKKGAVGASLPQNNGGGRLLPRCTFFNQPRRRLSDKSDDASGQVRVQSPAVQADKHFVCLGMVHSGLPQLRKHSLVAATDYLLAF